ncbi:DsbA family protein [Nitrosopumilus ureiphilus]|uniref:DsbA family protein n=1 Tax=Nitrosopumilus ureiphilus TaxID=1470067 RepID=UPI0015C78777|nr:thioredoxin domain-containing protein [Nitrosopumilus ureiphilus]
MKTSIVIILLIVAGFVTYGVFFTQPYTSEIVISKNFGTITTSLGSPFLGSSQAPITIIEFGNYPCIECQTWFQETRPDIIRDYINQGEINMIFIDTQLTKDIPLASFASYCANDQKKYWDYHDALFRNVLENKIDVNHLKQYAVELGLDMKLFEECLDTKKYEKKIKYSIYEAKKNGINRLPTFIIMDSSGKYEKILGAQPYSIFKEKIRSMQD